MESISTRMEREAVVKKCFTFIKGVALIVLIICAGFFVQNIWIGYHSKTTGIKVHSEIKNFFPAPAITICFNPGAKISVLKKYDIAIEQFWNFEAHDNLTYPELFEEAVFRLGQDFTLYIGWNNWQKFAEISNTTTIETDSVSVEELYTLANGLCYKVMLKEMLEPFDYFSIGVKFKEEYQVENLPSMDYYFTSENNADGIIVTQWHNGEIFKVSAKPSDNQFYDVLLKPVEYQKLDTTSGCEDSSSIMKCASQR